jgi:hypothetical protein
VTVQPVEVDGFATGGRVVGADRLGADWPGAADGDPTGTDVDGDDGGDGAGRPVPQPAHRPTATTRTVRNRKATAP